MRVRRGRGGSGRGGASAGGGGLNAGGGGVSSGGGGGVSSGSAPPTCSSRTGGGGGGGSGEGPAGGRHLGPFLACGGGRENRGSWGVGAKFWGLPFCPPTSMSPPPVMPPLNLGTLSPPIQNLLISPPPYLGPPHIWSFLIPLLHFGDTPPILGISPQFAPPLICLPDLIRPPQITPPQFQLPLPNLGSSPINPTLPNFGVPSNFGVPPSKSPYPPLCSSRFWLPPPIFGSPDFWPAPQIWGSPPHYFCCSKIILMFLL